MVQLRGFRRVILDEEVIEPGLRISLFENRPLESLGAPLDSLPGCYHMDGATCLESLLPASNLQGHDQLLCICFISRSSDFDMAAAFANR